MTRNPEIGDNRVWILPNTCSLGWVRNTKFETNVCNRMLSNAAKFQSYSFYRVIKEKPTDGGGEGRGGIKLPPIPTQIGIIITNTYITYSIFRNQYLSSIHSPPLRLMTPTSSLRKFSPRFADFYFSPCGCKFVDTP